MTVTTWRQQQEEHTDFNANCDTEKTTPGRIHEERSVAELIGDDSATERISQTGPAHGRVLGFLQPTWKEIQNRLRLDLS